MEGNQITVVYKWTARPEKLGALTDLCKGATKAMEENEPGATAVHVFVSEDDKVTYVREEFAGANALGSHLSQATAAHFPDLLAIATPRPF